MDYYIGIDVGTSSAKLILIDEQGNTRKQAEREYRFSEPQPGWKEIDPEIWTRAVEEAMADLLQGEEPEKVRAIGVTGQMHTVVFLDEEGKSVRPALMWNDTRTAEMVPLMKEKIQKIQKISYLSRVISTGSPAMNLLWLKKQEPAQFARVKKFLIGPDYLVYRLTGSIQTDYCEASTSSLADLQTGEWSEEMRKLLDFPAEIYPAIKGTCEIAGEIRREWCEKYHLTPGVKVITGTGDNPAAAIATGCFLKKYPVLSLGTSGVLMYPKEEINFAAKGKNILFSFDRKKMQILVQGVVQSCGSSINWWIRDVLHADKYNEKTKIDPDHLGKNPLLFYPHLVGEKTIYGDPSLRGAFLGMGTDTTRREMTIAVLEGIAFGIRQLAEEMQIPRNELERLKVIGGGAKNEVWMQILAHVLNVPVEQVETGTGAGYGIALAAAGAVGVSTMEELISRTVKGKNVFYPKENNVKLYEEKYGRYVRIYDGMKHIFEEKKEGYYGENL